MWNGNGHSRHATKDNESKTFRVVRTAKNRYVYLTTKNKRLKKEWLDALNYPILPYPKRQNQNYILGEYQKPILVQAEQNNSISAKVVPSSEVNETEICSKWVTDLLGGYL